MTNNTGRLDAPCGSAAEPPREPLPKIIVLHESLLQSWGRDLVTFGWLLGGLWLNHHHLGGSVVVTTTLCIGFFVFGMFTSKNTKVTVDEAIRVLQAMKAARGEPLGEPSKSSPSSSILSEGSP